MVLGLGIILGELRHHVRMVDGQNGRRGGPEVEVARALGGNVGVELRDEDWEAVAVGVWGHGEVFCHLAGDWKMPQKE